MICVMGRASLIMRTPVPAQSDNEKARLGAGLLQARIKAQSGCATPQDGRALNGEQLQFKLFKPPFVTHTCFTVNCAGFRWKSCEPATERGTKTTDIRAAQNKIQRQPRQHVN